MLDRPPSPQPTLVPPRIPQLQETLESNKRHTRNQ